MTGEIELSRELGAAAISVPFDFMMTMFFNIVLNFVSLVIDVSDVRRHIAGERTSHLTVG